MAASLFSLEGKNVLITGGTRGIGASCALALAQAGASVCLSVRPGSGHASNDHPGLTPLRDYQSQNQKHTTVECDLKDMQSVRTLFGRALEKEEMGGRIDILVNCAGLTHRHEALEFPEEHWDEVIDVNLKALWLLSQAAGRHMVPRKSGKIVNIGSLTTYVGGVNIAAYTASKGAVGQLTKALSNEWAPHNVQVNGIAPGYIATDLNTDLRSDEKNNKSITERIPAGRWGKPQDIMGPLIFLCSEASAYVSGTMVLVDGGFLGR